VDLKQLQFLCALDKTRHFGEAAKLCFVTQPTLSMRVRALEEELGLPLVRRGHRFEGFTAEGERILHWARQIITAQGALKAEAAAFKGQIVGRARVGQVPFTTLDLMPVIAAIHRDHPQLTFSVISQNNQLLVDAVADGQLDAAVVYDEGLNHQRFVFEQIHHSRFELLYSADYFESLAIEQSLGWQQLSELPLGMLTSAHHFRKTFNATLTEQGIALEPLLESDSLGSIISAVREGICCAIIPSQFFKRKDIEGLGRVALQGDVEALAPLGLLYKRQTPLAPITELLKEAVMSGLLK